MRDLRPLLVLAPAATITGWLLALLLTFAATFTGCATAPSDGMVTVPRVPEWRIPTDTRVYSARDIYAAVVRHAPGADVSISDSTFTAVSHEWLQDAATWSWHFSKAIGWSYTAESADCDKFAVGVSFAANVAASRARVKAQPLVVRIWVIQAHAYGGIPAGGAHALNAVLTDRGLMVYEPQTRVTVPLDAYPNRAYITHVLIGG